MKSRAELDKEPRLMQFVIERVCEKEASKLSPESLARAESLLPLVVWVDLSGATKIEKAYDCGGKFYLIPHKEAKRIRKPLGLETISGHAICEHTGYLCE